MFGPWSKSCYLYKYMLRYEYRHYTGGGSLKTTALSQSSCITLMPHTPLCRCRKTYLESHARIYQINFKGRPTSQRVRDPLPPPPKNNNKIDKFKKKE